MSYRHRPPAQGAPERASKPLPHLHRFLGNLETWLAGTHHGVAPDRLQGRLGEFTFRFNRRRTAWASFQTLLGLASSLHGPTTYETVDASESAR